jgi:hypothetical protein
MTDYVLCEICGWEKPAETPKDVSVKHNDDAREVGGLVDQFGRVYNQVDASVVYVLGYKTVAGVKKKQLDMYSGLTGYHIRTIPDRRWRNPALVGAGNSYLAIVDRFQDCDVIRITDQYCGLKEENFDNNGVVKDEINLEEIEDLARVTTPSGSQVVGLTILPRGVLIANIVDEQQAPRFLKVDVTSLVSGVTQPGFNGIEDVGEPFDTLGPLKGSPGRFDMAIGENMFYFVGLIDGGEGQRGIAITHLMTGEVRGFVGLPDEYVPLAVAHGQGNIHVLVQEKDAPPTKAGEVPVGTKVLRLPFLYGNYMLTGGSENSDYVLEPQDFAVTHSYATQDGQSEASSIAGAIEAARRINTDYDEELMGPEVTDDMVDTRPVEETTAQVIAPRTQVEEDCSQSTYADAREIPVTVVTIPEGINIYDIEGFGNVLVEGSFEKDEEELDNTKPFFRAFHGSHYDYLSDGGWMFGCVQEVDKEDEYGNPIIGDDGEPETEFKSVLSNSGITPMSMAVDNIVNPGKLKIAPDLTPILIDKDSGKILYRSPKVGEYREYAGQYASLKLAETNLLKRSPCSDEADKLATNLDGIDRTGSLRVPVRDTEHPVDMPGFAPDIYPLETFYNELDYDESCELYERRIMPSASHAEVQLTQKTWTQREEAQIFDIGSPPYLPEWRQARTNPIAVEKSSDHGETFWSGGGLEPVKFTASGGGGYWFLNLMKERTRLADELRLDIQDIRDEIETLNKEKETLEDEKSSDPTPADDRMAEIETRINAIESTVESNENQIEAINNSIDEMDLDSYEDNPVQFRTPRNILNKIHKIEARMPQEIDPVTGDSNITEMVPEPADTEVWGVCPVRFKGKDPVTEEEIEETKDCGIVVDPGIRSWVGIDILCNYWGVFVDGADGYTHPETSENGLGICLGTNPRLHHFDVNDNPFGRFPGYIYEAGYMCSPWGDGAWGAWEVTIKVNGRPIKEVCTRTTFLEQIYEQAPSELMEALYYDMMMNMDSEDNGFHRGHAYFTDELVEEVTINVKLINYATMVFRYGFTTVEIYHDWSFNCPGYDPGYWAGNDCEGMACGNVTCTSLNFGAKNKLYASDPVIPLTKQLVWEGEATYSFPETDPLSEKGQTAGRFIDCYFAMDLMCPIPGFKVDIRSSTYNGGSGGPHSLAGW